MLHGRTRQDGKIWRKCKMFEALQFQAGSVVSQEAYKCFCGHSSGGAYMLQPNILLCRCLLLNTGLQLEREA